MRSNREMVLGALRGNGLMLEHASADLRGADLILPCVFLCFLSFCFSPISLALSSNRVAQ